MAAASKPAKTSTPASDAAASSSKQPRSNKAKHERAAAQGAMRTQSARDLIAFLPQRYVERFAVEQLEDFPGNPKDHDLGAIAESIDANGFYGVLIVQDWPGVPKYILAGHGRKDTLIAKHVEHVPVMLVECDARTARRIVLADNRIVELGGYNLPALAEFLEHDALDGNLAGTGYSGDDVDDVRERLRDYHESLGRGDEGDEQGAPTDEERQEAALRQRFVLYPMARVIDEAFTHFRAHGFPYRDLPLHVQLQEMNALAATPQDKALRSIAGYAVADTYHKHRFHATARGKTSPVDSFNRDDRLRRAIEFELEQGGKVGDKLFATLTIVRGTQACANFRPGYAMYLYRRFAPIGGTVLDPCTGYGGRLLGWIASAIGGAYVGCDPNTPTDAANREMARVLAPPSCRVELHALPFEDYAQSIERERFDFAFTSPPYFAKELYSTEPTQSYLRYQTISAWRDGFLQPMLSGCYRGLKAGAHCLINIADVEINGVEYALEGLTRECGAAAGFELLDVLDFSIPVTIGQGERPEGREPVFVFRKPS